MSAPTDGLEPITLVADGTGSWRDGTGAANPELRGCIDVDISVTPFTNTLPIRRLRLAPGESTEVEAVYVDISGMLIKPVKQRYTRLDYNADGRDTYEYCNVESGYSAIISVDPDGLVVDYPDAFERVWER